MFDHPVLSLGRFDPGLHPFVSPDRFHVSDCKARHADAIGDEPADDGSIDDIRRAECAEQERSAFAEPGPGLGIAERVDAILCSALEGCEKPEAAFFELALARTGAKAATTCQTLRRIICSGGSVRFLV